MTAIYDYHPHSKLLMYPYIYYMATHSISLRTDDDMHFASVFNQQVEQHSDDRVTMIIFTWACKWNYPYIAQSVVRHIYAPYMYHMSPMPSAIQVQLMRMLYTACSYGRAPVAYTILNIGKSVASFDIHDMRQLDRLLRCALMHNTSDMFRLCTDLVFIQTHSYTQYLLKRANL